MRIEPYQAILDDDDFAERELYDVYDGGYHFLVQYYNGQFQLIGGETQHIGHFYANMDKYFNSILEGVSDV